MSPGPHPTGTAEPARRPPYVLLRALLTSIALLITLVPGMVVLGGYLPDLPTVGRLGLYLTTDLLKVLLIGLVPLVPVWLALRLGGGRFTRLLGALVSGVVALILVAGGALWVTAAANGAAYSPVRQLEPAPAASLAPELVDIATVGGVDLHAELWSAARQAQDVQPGPALVFVHGGAFIAGELGSREWLFDSLARAGVTVIDIEYRLAPPPRWRDAPGDVLCALAWLRERADEWLIDPNRVVLAGDSAGGSLALVAGYIAGRDPSTVPMEIESSCGGDPIVPAGIVAIEPAADLEGLWQDQTITDGSARFPEAYIGGPPVEFPERYDAASPFSHIHAGVPPTLIVTGSNDHLVPLRRVQAIADVLEQATARYRLIVIPFADHGLDGTPTIAGSQILEGLLPRFLRDPAAVVGP